MKTDVKAVVFDCGGVMITDGFKKIVPILSKKIGVSEDDLYRAYLDTIDPNYMKGLVKVEDRWNAMFDKLSIRAPLRDFLIEVHKIYQPIKDSIELVPKLKQAGFKVGVVSNQSEDTLAYLKEKYPTFFKLFDFYIWSCELGYSKPDQRMYEKALKAATVPAAQCLYVDDNDKFLDKAKNLGFHTLKFQSPQQLHQAFISGKMLKEDPPERNRDELKKNYKFVGKL